jgi:hypothetical protein
MLNVMDLASLAMESQRVIWLRLARFALGGPAAASEAVLMVTEKLTAATQAATDLATGASPEHVVAGLRARVRANEQRLAG